MTTEEQVWESIRDRRPFDLVFEDGTVVKVEHRGGDRPWRGMMITYVWTPAPAGADESSKEGAE